MSIIYRGLRKVLFYRYRLWQWGVVVIASLAGFLLLMLTVQLRYDYDQLTAEEPTLFSSQTFLSVSKRINTLRSLRGQQTAFDPEEIAALRAQPFTQSVVPFVRSEFTIQAFAGSQGGMPAMGSDLFFEALPTRFLDLAPPDFTWEPTSTEIPVIIPRSYLALYNFGFAPSRGMPQFSENAIQQVSFRVHLQGQGQRRQYTGRIVGLSDRIETVLVPYAFLQQANRELGHDSRSAPTRLLLESDQPGDPALATYLEDHNYQTNQEQLRDSKSNLLLQVVSGAVAGLALLLVGLALLVVIFSLQVHLQRNREQLRSLYLLGYPFSTLFWPYWSVSAGVFLGVFALAALLGRYLHRVMQAQTELLFPNYEPSMGPLLITGLVLWLVLMGLQGLMLRQNLRQLAHG